MKSKDKCVLPAYKIAQVAISKIISKDRHTEIWKNIINTSAISIIAQVTWIKISA